MRARPFAQVDVFTAIPYRGNPVAVVLDGEELSTEEMQRFARWTNLSETTFVLPATVQGADYQLRIFTPAQELPFAGHPTLGSAHAVIEERGFTRDKLVQQCKTGLVEIAHGGDGVSFRLPAYEIYDPPQPERFDAVLRGAERRGQISVVSVGPHWAIAELADEASVRSLAIDAAALTAYTREHGIDLTVFARTANGAVVRSFAPADNIPEDPVCGSGNGAVAAYRLAAGQIGPGDAYTATQGREIGRDGEIAVRIGANSGIHIGGRCVTCVRGEVTL